MAIELPERHWSMFCTKCGYSNPDTSARANAPCENSNCQYFAFVTPNDYTAAQMREHEARVRAEAMEEAAKACEARITNESGMNREDYENRQCALRIRSLINKEAGSV